MMDVERRLAAVERRLASIIAVGRISRPDAGTGRATVVIEAPEGDVATHDLPVLYPRTHTERDQWTHRAGEHVVCVFLPTGTEAGFVIGAYYAGTAPPSEDAADRIIHGGRVHVHADTRAVIASDDVRLGGADAAQALVRGDAWAAWVTEILLGHTHPTPAGGSSPSLELTTNPPTGYLSTTVRTR